VPTPASQPATTAPVGPTAPATSSTLAAPSSPVAKS
jgi:hypothetical protein